jgi:hypothetical protein
MNVYLIPFYDDSGCDILKITACSLESCKAKIIEHYANSLDDDELAGIEEYDEFLDTIYDKYELYIGEIHEIEEYES